MPNTIISPNMSLPVPVVGVDPGPQWATDVNSCLTLIDSHNHAAGSGVQITPAGININVDLPFNGNNLTTIRASKYTSQGTALPGASNLNSTYVTAGDLYFNDGSGNQIQITASGAVAGTPGSISGLVSPASASYNSGSGTFVFQSGANIAGNIDGASIKIREQAVATNAITLSSPTSLSANYTLTFPGSLPGSTRFLTVDSSGNIGDVYNTDNVTVEISSSNIQLKDNGITQAKAKIAEVSFLIPGMIQMWGATSTPTGFLLCDGSAVSRTTYAALYAVIGDAFGNGDGSSTFNVPDLRGRFIRGVDSGAGRDPDSGSRTAMNPGGNTGDNVGSVQDDQFESHTHTYARITANTLPLLFGTVYENRDVAAPVGTTNATGGNETRPINAYLTYIIKY